MRNLVAYPVTLKESIQSLNDQKKAIMDMQLIGDMRPVILSYVIEFLDGNKDFETFLATKHYNEECNANFYTEKG